MNERRFRFVHLTDVHVQPELGAFHAWTKVVQKILTLRPRPAFVTTGGDAVMDALAVSRQRATALYRLFREGTDALRTPVYHAFGNHDAYAWARNDPVLQAVPGYGKEMFKRLLGQPHTYFSFNYAHWHFIILDSIRHIPPFDWVAEIDEQQMEWLSRDLARAGKWRPVAMITHVPLFTIFTQYNSGATAVPSDKMIVRNAKEIRDIFKDYNIKAVLQGHTHVVEECVYTGTRYISCGAISGEWWRGPRLGVHPEGFVVLDIEGDNLRWEYVSYGWQAQSA